MDKYDEMAREALGGATTGQARQAYEFQVAAVASALRQVAQEKERETLERAAKVCEALRAHYWKHGELEALDDAAEQIRALSTANELLTTQELADVQRLDFTMLHTPMDAAINADRLRKRHLSELEQEVMSRALKASVKIVDDGYVRVPREPTKEMLEAAVKARYKQTIYVSFPPTSMAHRQHRIFLDGAEAEAAADYRAMIQAAEKGE